jgi:hypothetical protein
MPKPDGAVRTDCRPTLQLFVQLTQQTVGQDGPYHGSRDDNSRLFDFLTHLSGVSFNDRIRTAQWKILTWLAASYPTNGKVLPTNPTQNATP